MKHPTYYRTLQVAGLSIFYREAGPKDAPTLLMLHGLPSSSRMFEPLFARLSDRHHLVAPDYPGFGHSDWPDPKTFAYTFDRYAEIMSHFTEALGLSRYTLYMQDYGGPVGFRMALADPDRIEALIVQDAVAHNEGLGANWEPRRTFWADRAANESMLRTNLLSLATTRTRHVGNDPNLDPTTRTCGPMNLPFSASPARPTFKATCSTTTERMWTPTRNGKRGCARSSRACWSSGASMISRSISRSQKRIAGTCRMLKFTSSTPVISHWTRLQMRSPPWSEASSVPHIEPLNGFVELAHPIESVCRRSG